MFPLYETHFWARCKHTPMIAFLGFVSQEKRHKPPLILIVTVDFQLQCYPRFDDLRSSGNSPQPPRSVTVPVSCLGPNGHCLSLLTPGVTATAAFYTEPVSKPSGACLQRETWWWSIVTPSLVDPNPVFFALISSQPSGRLYLSLLKYYKPNVWSMGWAASDKTECSNDPLCWVNNFWCAQFTIEN